MGRTIERLLHDGDGTQLGSLPRDVPRVPVLKGRKILSYFGKIQSSGRKKLKIVLERVQTSCKLKPKTLVFSSLFHIDTDVLEIFTFGDFREIFLLSRF